MQAAGQGERPRGGSALAAARRCPQQSALGRLRTRKRRGAGCRGCNGRRGTVGGAVPGPPCKAPSRQRLSSPLPLQVDRICRHSMWVPPQLPGARAPAVACRRRCAPPPHGLPQLPAPLAARCTRAVSAPAALRAAAERSPAPPAPAAPADIPMSNVQLINDLLPKSCSDPWLSAEDQFFCKRCCSLSTRRACLGTVGRKWNDGAGEPGRGGCAGGSAGRVRGRRVHMWGLHMQQEVHTSPSLPCPARARAADTQSCSWMSRDGKGLSVREVEYSIGELLLTLAGWRTRWAVGSSRAWWCSHATCAQAPASIPAPCLAPPRPGPRPLPAGVNFPYNIANVVNPATCREERLYTVLSPPEAYRCHHSATSLCRPRWALRSCLLPALHLLLATKRVRASRCAQRAPPAPHLPARSTAYFSVLASVDDPDDKIARPLGLAPDASCVVRAPARSCTVNFWSSDDVHFVMSSRWGTWCGRVGRQGAAAGTGTPPCACGVPPAAAVGGPGQAATVAPWAARQTGAPPGRSPAGTCGRPTQPSSAACAAPATPTACTAPARAASPQARPSATACTSQVRWWGGGRGRWHDRHACVGSPCRAFRARPHRPSARPRFRSAPVPPGPAGARGGAVAGAAAHL